MRCNLDIDRSLCFPTAIQSKSVTTIETARILETGEGHLSAGPISVSVGDQVRDDIISEVGI